MLRLRLKPPPSALLAALLLGSCGLPRDPEGTSERLATTHELRVGVTDNAPWTDATHAEPSGVEPSLVRRFAASQGARILWTSGSESSLVQGLKHHELDLVIGGFDSKTQWSTSAGATQPFLTDAAGKKHIFLAAPGENRFILSVDRFLTQHDRTSRAQG